MQMRVSSTNVQLRQSSAHNGDPCGCLSTGSHAALIARLQELRTGWPFRLANFLPCTLLPTAAFTTRDFRHALGQFATGVTIVTTMDSQGQPVGMTVSSFNSVSLDPPLVLWSLAHNAASLPVIQNCSHYAIHVLGAEQQALAQRFATRGIDRFAEVAWQPGEHGLPLLDGAAAIFICSNRSQYAEGDHTIFVGEVAQCQHGLNVVPLLYHGGRMYAQHGVPAAPYVE